jgi:hypothetical protein
MPQRIVTNPCNDPLQIGPRRCALPGLQARPSEQPAGLVEAARRRSGSLAHGCAGIRCDARAVERFVAFSSEAAAEEAGRVASRPPLAYGQPAGRCCIPAATARSLPDTGA